VPLAPLDVAARRPEAPTVGDLLSDPSHGGPLDGASRIGEAVLGDRRVRVGLWLDPDGRVQRARHRTSACAALIGYAEAACLLAEAGEPPGALRAGRLLAAVTGAHPLHRDRAELVARALAQALSSRPEVAEGSR